MADDKKRGLGRGLSALLADVDLENTANEANTNARLSDRNLPIEYIVPNEDQPRKVFDVEALEELAQSIKEKGMVQPIIVRKIDDEKYQIVAGERRWRAAQMAKLHQIPVIIRKYSDVEVQEIALIENIQRDNLNALEEAEAYYALMQTHGHTQEKLAAALGKSRSHIANLLRLMNLHEAGKEALLMRQISMGHARALIGLDHREEKMMLNAILREELSVREVERRVRKMQEERAGSNATPISRERPNKKSADIKFLEAEVSAALGLKFTIEDKNGSGNVKITYSDLEELDRLCQLLGK